MPNVNDDYINKYIDIGMDTPDTIMGKEVGDEVIIYGISKTLVPIAEGQGILFMESDTKYAQKHCTINILIDKTNSLSSILNEGVSNFMFNKPTFVRGHVAAKRKIVHDCKEVTEVLIKPSHDMRVVL